MKNGFTLQLKAGVDGLQRINAELDRVGESEEWPPALDFQIKLAIEELLMNIIHHGDRGGGKDVECRVSSSADAVEIELTDFGPRFNPFADAPEADTTSGVEERGVGGLGIHFVTELMSTTHYERKKGRNFVRLVRQRD